MAHEHEKHHHDHGHHHDDHGDGHHSHDHAHGHDGFHDWHSPRYVGDWIAKDRQRESERLPIIERLVAAVPFAREAAIDVIDIGAGAGFVSNLLLQAFPHARVTLQDFSQPMLDRARARFAGRAVQLKYVECDLRDPAWPKAVCGPFDLAVSAIAIHNVRELSAMAACYEAVHGLLKPGGCFIDCDHFDRYGGVPLHLHMFRVAGFRNTETIWHEHPTAVLKASF